MSEIHLKIVYHHGEAAHGRLDMYDAAVSLQGFSRALAISTHLLLNDGEIRRRGNTAHGARFVVQAPRQGSFEQLITVIFEHPELIGVGLVTNAFWDTIKWSWGKTMNLIHEPETSTVKRLAAKIEPRMGELEEALELPLASAHRPIRECEDVVITLKRQRLGSVIQLDKETLRSVSLQTESSPSAVVGNVTRYNILSGFGRLYDDGEEKTVAFKIAEQLPKGKTELLTWSLNEANRSSHSKLVFTVSTVKSAKGLVRRYIVHDVGRVLSPPG